MGGRESGRERERECVCVRARACVERERGSTTNWPALNPFPPIAKTSRTRPGRYRESQARPVGPLGLTPS